MSAALTPWFPADVNPVREGSYERDWRHTDDPVKRRDYWDGKYWYACANGEFNVDPLDILTTPRRWRGLASDPSVTP